MSKRDSYLNTNNILTEGTLSTIFKFLTSSKFREVLKTQNSKLNDAVNNFNDAMDELDDAIESEFGKPAKKQPKLTVKDLFRK